MRRMATGLLVLLAAVGTASAVSVSYTTGDAVVLGLGNNGYPSPYDSLTITGQPQTTPLEITDIAQILDVGEARFDVGYSSYGEFNNTLTVTRDITVNGVTKELVQRVHGFSLYAGDYMQLDEGATVTFELAGGASLDVTPLGLGLPASGGLGVGQSATGTLYARFVDSPAVPEPLTMFSALMAISGLGAYLRKRTNTAA